MASARKGLVTHLNAALMQQFLHIPVTQRKAVVQPDRVLDDCHRETVAVGLGVGHGQSAYPDPVKATQPILLLPSQLPGIQEEPTVNAALINLLWTPFETLSIRQFLACAGKLSPT